MSGLMVEEGGEPAGLGKRNKMLEQAMRMFDRNKNGKLVGRSGTG
jgi:hypothetical protein